MKNTTIRTLVAAGIFIVLSAGLVAGIGMGTLSGFGWETISLLCPLGALTTMIATKTLIPHAIVSLVIMAVLVFLVGRAFCGWVCPVPVLNRLRQFFRSPKKRREEDEAERQEVLAIAKQEIAAKAGAEEGEEDEEGCTRHCDSCSSCATTRKKLDSRHYVLGGALLSTAIFGFPVFCLVCPVGLTFATVLVIWRLFSAGDMTIAVVLIPLMLAIEILFLRKWCTRFCPLAGLMNLVSRFGKTAKPVIDDSLCLETSTGTACSKCTSVCEADINVRHPQFGERTLADCTRCRACVEVCPTKAISMPFFPKKQGVPVPVSLAAGKADDEVTRS